MSTQRLWAESKYEGEAVKASMSVVGQLQDAHTSSGKIGEATGDVQFITLRLLSSVHYLWPI